jgi:8-amino-7-oxononanoate synthase
MVQTTSFRESLRLALEQRQGQHLYRHRRTLESAQQPVVIVDGSTCLSFCSNDYLGLANHPEVNQAFIKGIEKYGAGSGASHLVSGHNKAHEELEEALRHLAGSETPTTMSRLYGGVR